jgi:uncharacterized NAD(P)/FAD-binding protein YdhS
MIRCDVAIVGGGFSGSVVAAQLARRTGPDFSALMFEPEEAGRGAAYGTRHGEHALNTRAAAMSAFPDDPNHFVRWLGARAAPQDFVSRRIYGDYVAEIAGRAFERPRFAAIKNRVTSIVRSDGFGFGLQTASGANFEARSVVLATGNAPPNVDVLPAQAVEHPGYVADPWRFDYRPVGGTVLLVGSGLTALDVLVALEASGHRGIVHVVSRRGRFPETHAEGVRPYDVVPVLDTSDARGVLRSFRQHVRDAQTRGFDWRAVVDAIRPECEALWKRLPVGEQRRFDRHLRTHWERYRHRAPLHVDAARERYARSGRLRVYAGRLSAFEAGSATIAVAGGERVVLRPDWIVNCTGPGRNRRLFAREPLATMRDEGILTPEALGLGVRVTGDLVAIDAAGKPVDGLWVLGPLAKGSRFEATAVPELRVMAQAVAIGLLQAFSREAAAGGPGSSESTGRTSIR